MPIPPTSCAPPRSCAAIWPNDHITLGHALLSESREFERGVTAAVNAAVQPLLDRYIRRLAQRVGSAAATAVSCW